VQTEARHATIEQAHGGDEATLEMEEFTPQGGPRIHTMPKTTITNLWTPGSDKSGAAFYSVQHDCHTCPTKA